MSSREARIKYYWKKACEYDGILPGSTTAVFSLKNPYVKTYTLLMRDFYETKAKKQNITSKVSFEKLTSGKVRETISFSRKGKK